MKYASNISIGICEWSIPKSTNDIISFAAECKLDGISLQFAKDWNNHPYSHKIAQQELLKKCEYYQISLPNMGINALCQYGMSKKDNYDKVIKVYKRALDIASSLSIPLLQVPSFGSGMIESEEDLENTIKCLKKACELAKPYGISIATENALNSEDNLKIITEVNMPNIYVFFDSQNPFVVNGYDSSLIAKNLFKHIKQVHAKDGIGQMGNTLLGEGECDFYKSMSVLKENNYSGFIITETSYNDIESVKKDISTIKNFFEETL